MQYIIDENQDITHVVVPIEEWNRLQEGKSGINQINPYQKIIDYLQELLEKEIDYSSPPPSKGLAYLDIRDNILESHKLVKILKELLEGYILPSKELLSNIIKIQIKFYAVSNINSIAIGYILRNDDFYHKLKTKNKSIKKDYGFDLDDFYGSELSKVYLNNNRYDFIFSVNALLGRYFSLKPIKSRIRKEPEVLRFFYFDLFRIVDELKKEKPEFESIFQKYPLVDMIAKAVYSENSLSGATSRVYKARKEAETIVNGDWKKYVEPIA